ncbi:putative MFS siderophore transporter [Lophiostoma macrostomum CBS 122681]|uniref:Putative MFS siderophore transporter n=1 Tax=Lophiostoma macrostomum CBS 122681 TaxID=1314788 RepID=A0A6A6T1S2_9PLEO|nr:putative MFS siderophore transporter [Lophiostoma macrostomum CBS 122681]
MPSLRTVFQRRNTEDQFNTQRTQDYDLPSAAQHGDEKAIGTSAGEPVVVDTETQKPVEELPAGHAQDGVRKVEAMTLTWTKSSLAVAYIFMFLLYFVNAFQSSITGNLTAYVLSGFEAHSLIPVISIVSNVMCAAAYLPVAKLLNVWGRPQGFLIMASLSTLGLILMATTKDVQTYCAAQVFYSVGFTGMIFSIDVITADTSSLKDRGLAYAFTSSPYIITALAGPAAAEGFYEKISWRWAFGCFAIILPFVAAPLFGTLLFNQQKAKKKGLLIKEPSGRTILQSIWHYILEFDALGVLLLASGLVLFLLPFSLASSTSASWRSASILTMLILGSVLLAAFALAERLVPKPFLPFHLLASRTVMGACLLDATYQIAYYCWASYFSSYLQVVHGLSITQAGWVSGVFDIIAGLWLLFVGYLIRRSLRYKWLLLCAVPLYTLGVGLMIYFRMPHTNVGYIVLCQVLIAFAGSTMILGQQVAITCTAEHDQVSACLALLGLFGYVGGAVGNSVSAAIWTHTLPRYLQSNLPEQVRGDWEAIYGDLELQLSYEMGDPVREVIIQGYGKAQRRMLIAGTGVMALAFVWVALMKNVKLSRQQTKGIVF